MCGWCYCMSTHAHMMLYCIVLVSSVCTHVHAHITTTTQHPLSSSTRPHPHLPYTHHHPHLPVTLSSPHLQKHQHLDAPPHSIVTLPLSTAVPLPGGPWWPCSPGTPLAHQKEGPLKQGPRKQGPRPRCRWAVWRLQQTLLRFRCFVWQGGGLRVGCWGPPGVPRPCLGGQGGVHAPPTTSCMCKEVDCVCLFGRRRGCG